MQTAEAAQIRAEDASQVRFWLIFVPTGVDDRKASPASASR
jgi:hypothetical protein